MLPALIEPLPEIRIGPFIWVEAPPVEPERPCLANNCIAPAAGHVMWLTPDWSQVCVREACATHIAICKELGGCAVFPLDCVPPQDVVLNAINGEILRRQGPPRPVYQTSNVFFNNVFVGTTNTTGFFEWR